MKKIYSGIYEDVFNTPSSSLSGPYPASFAVSSKKPKKKKMKKKLKKKLRKKILKEIEKQFQMSSDYIPDLKATHFRPWWQELILECTPKILDALTKDQHQKYDRYDKCVDVTPEQYRICTKK